ncbi:Glutaredoxin [Spraguea lophii 42_110]|uniref:Glutaredoxin n=1 Tax=Spraguea lophii (strain 42_110) TaxID=1358809 RepID=S7XI85_SPRLO|nr:Glutaredoxin [Spraguea lophii 42_110]
MLPSTLKYTLIFRTNCGFCELAKELLTELNIKVNFINTEDMDTKIVKQLQDKYNHRTYPMIFLDKFIGGYSDLFEKNKNEQERKKMINNYKQYKEANEDVEVKAINKEENKV